MLSAMLSSVSGWFCALGTLDCCGDGVLVHRFITGVPTFTSPAHDEIQLWTPEGGQTIALDGQPVKIATVSEDGPLTVQLNRSGQVIGQMRQEGRCGRNGSAHLPNVHHLAGAVELDGDRRALAKGAALFSP